MQEHLGLADDGAAHGNPLALTAGQGLAACGPGNLQVEQLGGLATRLALVLSALLFSANAMFSPTVMCGYSA